MADYEVDFAHASEWHSLLFLLPFLAFTVRAAIVAPIIWPGSWISCMNLPSYRSSVVTCCGLREDSLAFFLCCCCRAAPVANEGSSDEDSASGQFDAAGTASTETVNPLRAVSPARTNFPAAVNLNESFPGSQEIIRFLWFLAVADLAAACVYFGASAYSALPIPGSSYYNALVADLRPPLWMVIVPGVVVYIMGTATQFAVLSGTCLLVRLRARHAEVTTGMALVQRRISCCCNCCNCILEVDRPLRGRCCCFRRRQLLKYDSTYNLVGPLKIYETLHLISAGLHILAFVGIIAAGFAGALFAYPVARNIYALSGIVSSIVVAFVAARTRAVAIGNHYIARVGAALIDTVIEGLQRQTLRDEPRACVIPLAEASSPKFSSERDLGGSIPSRSERAARVMIGGSLNEMHVATRSPALNAAVTATTTATAVNVASAQPGEIAQLDAQSPHSPPRCDQAVHKPASDRQDLATPTLGLLSPRAPYSLRGNCEAVFNNGVFFRSGHKDGIWCIAVLSDGMVASGGVDCTVRVWDVKRRLCIRTMHHDKKVECLAPLSNGLLASGSDDGTVRVWNVHSGTCVHTLHHDKDVCCLAPLESGLLASGSYDSTVRVWDLQSGACSLTLHHKAGVFSLAPLPDGCLAVGACDITIWNLLSGTCELTLIGHTFPVSQVCVVPGNRLASGTMAERDIRIWDRSTGSGLYVLHGQSGVQSLTLLADGRLTSGHGNGFIYVWDMTTHTCVLTMRGHSSNIVRLELLPDGRLASGSWDKDIRVWNVRTGVCHLTLTGHTSFVKGLAVLPNGKLVSAGADSQIRLWA